MKERELWRWLPIALILCCALLFAAFIFVTNITARAWEKSEEGRIELLVTAYGVMTEHLAEAGLLPELTAVALVEEHFLGVLSPEGMEAFARKLAAIYPYHVSISYGHDRLEKPKDDTVALIYISTGTPRAEFNKIPIYISIDNSEHSVQVTYTYFLGKWLLRSTEVR